MLAAGLQGLGSAFARRGPRALGVVVAALVVGWAALAIWIDAGSAVVALIYALVSGAFVLAVRPRWGGLALAAALFAGVLSWWLSLEPRNDREWRPDLARLPRMSVDGDRLRVADLRAFSYRSEDDFDERWEPREYDLSAVRGLDLFLSDWGAPLIVHTILSWEFESGEHLAVSIEARRETDEGYSALRSFFRQFELYYAVADERDVIGLRAAVRGETLRLYRLDVPPAAARALLVDYARRVEALAVEPAWYNALTANCTTTVRLHVRDLGLRRPFDWRLLANGRVDELLYDRGRLGRALSFDELRARSDVTAAARAAAGAPGFSARIRAGLPPRPAFAPSR